MRTIKHILMVALLSATYAVSAQNVKLPIVLMQDLRQPVEKVVVVGMHNVAVVTDTANYVSVVTSGTYDQIESLRFPTETMEQSGSQLTITKDFPYKDRIEVHTTELRLTVECGGDSRVELRSADGDTVNLEFLSFKANGHACGMLDSPVKASQVELRSVDYASIRYHSVIGPDLERVTAGEGHIWQINVADAEPAFRYTMPITVHRIFGGYAFGVSGWSASPFGGMNVPMANYAMGVTAYGQLDIRIGYNYLRTRHWDFGMGYASHVETFSFPNVFMGVTTDATTGLSHFGAVDVAQYNHPSYAGQTCVKRSRMSVVYLQIPLRAEWHRRLDYKGVRLAAELRPGFAIGRKKSVVLREVTWTEGSYADQGRTDIWIDTIGALINPFRCDLRLEIGWNHVSFFVQSALTPLFRTALKNEHPAIDEKIFPMTMGFSFNF